MAREAADQSDAVLEGQRSIRTAMLSTHHTLIESIQLYTLKAEELSDWPEVAKCLLEAGLLSVVFWDVLLRLMEVLRVICLRATPTQVLEVDENGNVVTVQDQPSPWVYNSS